MINASLSEMSSILVHFSHMGVPPKVVTVMQCTHAIVKSGVSIERVYKFCTWLFCIRLAEITLHSLIKTCWSLQKLQISFLFLSENFHTLSRNLNFSFVKGIYSTCNTMHNFQYAVMHCKDTGAQLATAISDICFLHQAKERGDICAQATCLTSLLYIIKFYCYLTLTCSCQRLKITLCQ